MIVQIRLADNATNINAINGCPIAVKNGFFSFGKKVLETVL